MKATKQAKETGVYKDQIASSKMMDIMFSAAPILQPEERVQHTVKEEQVQDWFGIWSKNNQPPKIYPNLPF